MKDRKHIIFKSYGLVDSRDWEEGYREFLEMNELDESDCCLDTFIRDDIDNWYDCEEDNLDKALPDDVVVVADLGFWNGRKWGYKVMGRNVNECLYWASECDDIEIYADRYDVRSVQYHHDGHHNMLYRVFKESLSEEQRQRFLDKIYYGRVTRADITRCTKSLLPYVREIYGWR